MNLVLRRLLQDPRHYQIAVLALLLGYGLVWLDFEVLPQNAVAILATAFLTQYICTRRWNLPRFDPKSACISGLSLCLLLRTNSLPLAVLAAIVTIASKFLIRWNSKHLFNPTNFGIVSMILLTNQVWVSPGQWGNAALFAFLMAVFDVRPIHRLAVAGHTLRVVETGHRPILF